MTLDLPLCLQQLILTGRLTAADDWGTSAQTGTAYADFSKAWKGRSPVPTIAELQAVWPAAQKASDDAADAKVPGGRKAILAALDAGTATTSQVQNAIAYLIRLG